MSQRTRWWQALLLSMVSVAFVFLVLEIAARTLSWKMGKGFWARPHSFESAFFVTYDWPPPLIQHGIGTFRAGQSVPMRKPPGELRVICLGGSTTVNARNAEGWTYSQLMQETLRPLFPEHEVWVLNAGADAFSTAHSLVNLSLRLLPFEPDVITVLHNINDLTARYFGDEMLPDYSNKYLDDAFLAYEHRGGLGGTVFRLSRGAQMLKWRVSVLRRTLERSSRGRGVENPELGRINYESHLRSIVALAHANQARPVLITQAHRDGEVDAESGLFRSYNDVIRTLGRELEAPVVDLSAQLSGRSEHFLDDVHFTSSGVQAVARLIAPIVAEQLKAVSAPRDPEDGPERSVHSD